jgi:hypothetical protein
MPAGIEADCAGYGFQKVPPVTSTISMLYGNNRASTVPMRGIFAGSAENYLRFALERDREENQLDNDARAEL